MDRTLLVGLGFSFAFGFSPYVFPEIPRFIGGAGLAFGISAVVWAALPGFEGVSIASTMLFVALCTGAGGTLGWRFSTKTTPSSAPQTSSTRPAFDIAGNARAELNRTVVSGNPTGILVARGNAKFTTNDSTIAGADGPLPQTLPQQGSPTSRTFGLADNSYVELNRSVVSGDPSSIVTAGGDASVTISNSIMIKSGVNVEAPLPNGEFSKLSSHDLRAEVTEFVIQLKDFQDKIDVTGINPDIDNSEFNKTLRNRGLSLMSELLSRVGPVERRPLPLTMRCGIDALNFGKLTGDHPASGAGAFLEFLVNKLPA